METFFGAAGGGFLITLVWCLTWPIAAGSRRRPTAERATATLDSFELSPVERSAGLRVRNGRFIVIARRTLAWLLGRLVVSGEGLRIGRVFPTFAWCRRGP
jgi:hypothetical protein